MTAGFDLADMPEAQLDAWLRQHPDAPWDAFHTEVSRLQIEWLRGYGWNPADKGLRPLTRAEVFAMDAVAVAALRVRKRHKRWAAQDTVDNCAGD